MDILYRHPILVFGDGGRDGYYSTTVTLCAGVRRLPIIQWSVSLDRLKNIFFHCFYQRFILFCIDCSMNEISVSDRKSTNNIAEFSIKDEKNYIVNVRKCVLLLLTWNMHILGHFQYLRTEVVWVCFITLCISLGRDAHALSGCAALLCVSCTLPFWRSREDSATYATYYYKLI